jgi:uncharacterized cupredoxin-like copper-binding protein
MLVLIPLLVVGGACAGDTDDAAEPTVEPSSTDISVEVKEFEIAPDPKTADAGEVTFAVENVGEETHEFVVVKTDLEPGKLPTIDDGSVEEEGLDVLGEVEDLAAGKDEELKLDMSAGDYVLLCNIVEEEEDGEKEAHYKQGMRTAFTVS